MLVDLVQEPGPTLLLPWAELAGNWYALVIQAPHLLTVDKNTITAAVNVGQRDVICAEGVEPVTNQATGVVTGKADDPTRGSVSMSVETVIVGPTRSGVEGIPCRAGTRLWLGPWDDQD